MDAPIRLEAADTVRGLMAAAYLRSRNEPPVLGSIVLHEHQLDAASRLRALLATSQGCLLADAVGLGKTYTALAVARHAGRTVVVAPASLLAMWKRCTAAAGVPVNAYVSHEALSRRHQTVSGHDFVIIDEAHHARNPSTRRYSALASLCMGSRVLLLSATPIHNATRDLRALFALFWGSRAWLCDIDEITQFIVRREQRAVTGGVLPVAHPPRWLALPHSDALLADIAALPPPLPPSDGGDGGALVLHGLIRQWASSNAALVRGLTRRKARALALIAALEDGRYPTIDELRAWSHAEDSLQLAFPGLVSSGASGTEALLVAVRAHERGLTGLLSKLREEAGSDRDRSNHLLQLRNTHPGARIIAFTQYADTARGLFGLVTPSGGCAMLTARGAVTVGGKGSRSELLKRFNARDPRESDRIDLLLATDLLSEGIDLPEVSVVVHLDLPWTPARLEQRVGRAVRLSSRHSDVHVYCMAPPASSAAILRTESILRQKYSDAASTLGVAGSILPTLGGEPPRAAATTSSEERMRAVLTRWLPPIRRNPAAVAPPAVGSVSGSAPGWIALIQERDRYLFVTCVAGRVSHDPGAASSLLAECEGEDVAIDPAALHRAREALDVFMQCRQGNVDAGLGTAQGYRFGARLLGRIGTITSRAPLHRRSAMAALAHQARRVVLAPRGIGSEQALGELADAILPDDAWLRAVGSFDAMSHEGDEAESRSRLVAIMLLKAPSPPPSGHVSSNQ